MRMRRRRSPAWRWVIGRRRRKSTYITPTDTSQDYQIDGLPFGTRGGMVVSHIFPSDGEYKFSIKNLRYRSLCWGRTTRAQSLTARECSYSSGTIYKTSELR